MEKVLKRIDALISLLEEDGTFSSEQEGKFRIIQEKSGYRLPKEIKNLLTDTSLVPDCFPNIFMGYEPLGVDGVASQYNDLKASLFFSGFSVNESLQAAQDHELRVFENEFGDCENPEIISDMSKLVPLFLGGSGYFIALFHKSATDNEIVVITQDYGICTLAPTFVEHLKNLKMGLKNGIYSYDSEYEEIDFPECWCERVSSIS